MQVLQERIRKVYRYNETLSNSAVTDEDVENLSNELKEAVWEKYSG